MLGPRGTPEDTTVPVTRGRGLRSRCCRRFTASTLLHLPQPDGDENAEEARHAQ
jgi:hypothetical protein